MGEPRVQIAVKAEPALLGGQFWPGVYLLLLDSSQVPVTAFSISGVENRHEALVLPVLHSKVIILSLNRLSDVLCRPSLHDPVEARSQLQYWRILMHGKSGGLALARCPAPREN